MAEMIKSAKTAEFLLTLLECIDGIPNIDWEKVAKKMGYKSPTVARVRFGQIKSAAKGVAGNAGSPNAKKPAAEKSKGKKEPGRRRGRPKKGIQDDPEDKFKVDRDDGLAIAKYEVEETGEMKNENIDDWD